MYSGSTLTSFSGRLLGAHQKIDRVARRHLEQCTPKSHFPKLASILHFEGGNGPDAIKRKSPAKDEPWHYIQPFDADDTVLPKLVEDHYAELVSALKDKDSVRAAFEAAWMAHAIVDGLTPAHHFPYEEKLVELRGGEGLETRRTIKEKVVFPGDNMREKAKNNWGFWGPKGLFTTHFAFEWGVATLIMPMSLKKAQPSKEDLRKFADMDIKEWFRSAAQDVAELKLYDSFYTGGWTTQLAREVRRELAPRLVNAVTVSWVGALQAAERTK